jgi:hypothetical protein
MVSLYKHYCDESVIVHCKKCKKPTTVAPNHTLSIDWDVLRQIRDSFSTASNPPAMIHVKSHQDDKKRYDELELKVQLNCLADKLAGAYMVAHSEDDLSKVPRFPGNLAQLHMAASTVTNKIACTIHNIRTEAPLLAKMIKDNPTWSVDTIDTIDWTVHGRAVNCHGPRKSTRVTQEHSGQIPAQHPPSGGASSQRYNPKYPRNCPSCNQDHENQHHLLVCPAESRKEWRCLMITKLRKHLDAVDTNLELMTIALDGIQSVLTGNVTHS